MADKGDEYLVARHATKFKLSTIKYGKVINGSGFGNIPNDFRKLELYNEYEDLSGNSYIEYYFLYNSRLITHKSDGPAIVYPNGELSNQFYFNGFHIKDLSQYCYLCDLSKEEELMLVLKYGN